MTHVCLLRAGVVAVGLACLLVSGSGVRAVEQEPAPVSTDESAPRQSDARAKGFALQVRLDRNGFSSGVIDGQPGPKTKAALALFQQARGLTRSEEPDAPTWQALGEEPAFQSYTITAEDMAGPFVKDIPDDMMEKARLEALAYRSVVEMLAERFHTTGRVLTTLNPDVEWEPGATLHVPNVEPFVPPARTETRDEHPPAAAEVAAVHVSKAAGMLTVKGRDGTVLFAAPVSSGSEHDPLPLGEWKVTAVYLQPIFNYNPDLFWDGDPSHAKARLPPGPNSPVGVVWIDLDKEHYGLHGTPEPERIGLSQSNGCVRLTNWDVMRLAMLVTTDTPVLFEP
jgi:lipoprotein-anchoring transpeptidase ErfK/SrfK